jgi:hypothetical protein
VLLAFGQPARVGWLVGLEDVVVELGGAVVVVVLVGVVVVLEVDDVLLLVVVDGALVELLDVEVEVDVQVWWCHQPHPRSRARYSASFAGLAVSDALAVVAATFCALLAAPHMSPPMDQLSGRATRTPNTGIRLGDIFQTLGAWLMGGYSFDQAHGCRRSICPLCPSVHGLSALARAGNRARRSRDQRRQPTQRAKGCARVAGRTWNRCNVCPAARRSRTRLSQRRPSGWVFRKVMRRPLRRQRNDHILRYIWLAQ